MNNDMREVEEEAKRLLAHYGNEGPPVEVMEIALAEGIELRIAPAGMSTCCAVIDGKKIIWVNRMDPPARRRFRIAHEIFEFLGFSERECDAGAAELL
ncbi:MAG: ImmA/IrrE family metallo-endopeptidase, partial [bacterium]